MFLTLSFLFGINIGSFLNVLIYRLPRSIPIHRPSHSQCTTCKHNLRPIDLFPILSYILISGKCRYCNSKIPPRYPFIEALTGIAWLVIGWHFLYLSWDPVRAIFAVLFVSVLIPIFLIDLEHMIIPDSLNIALLAIGISYNIVLIYTPSLQATTLGLPSSLLGAWIGCGFFWLTALIGRILFKKDAMGHGDFKLARGIGAFLFPFNTLLSIVVAIFLAVLMTIPLALFRKTPPTLQPEESASEPESVTSLIKSGLGYLLCIDVAAKIFPKLEKTWFGVEQEYKFNDDFPPIPGAIPFGPFLAAGAALVLIFNEWFLKLVELYINWTGLAMNS